MLTYSAVTGGLGVLRNTDDSWFWSHSSADSVYTIYFTWAHYTGLKTDELATVHMLDVMSSNTASVSDTIAVSSAALTHATTFNTLLLKK